MQCSIVISDIHPYCNNKNDRYWDLSLNCWSTFAQCVAPRLEIVFFCQRLLKLVVGRGSLSLLFGSQVSLRVHCCKRDGVYFATLLWQSNGRHNGLISRMLFSELYKIMVNKIIFVGFRGVIGAIVPRAVSAALHTPNWCGHAVTETQNSVQSPLSHPKKASTPQTEKEALEISEVVGPLKEKCLYITVNLGPFERKVFTHCNCCWGPVWKQSSLLIHYSCCSAPLKTRYFTHYRCYWGHLWKRSEPTYILHLLLWAPLKP